VIVDFSSSNLKEQNKQLITKIILPSIIVTGFTMNGKIIVENPNNIAIYHQIPKIESSKIPAQIETLNSFNLSPFSKQTYNLTLPNHNLFLFGKDTIIVSLNNHFNSASVFIIPLPLVILIIIIIIVVFWHFYPIIKRLK
jgi:hypothetical protein